MRNRVLRLAAVTACVCSLVVLTGCPVALEVINPDLLAQLGVPASATGTSGKVLVALTNNSQSFVTFNATPIRSDGSRTLWSWSVLPSENQTLVEDCPLAYFAPGDSETGLALTGTSVDILNLDGTVKFSLTFTGATLEQGVDYLCGDVIEMEVIQTGAGEAVEDFILRVRVRPGR